ncbi:MAG: AI-2E family transporter [Geminicoccaceae bacterium]
MGQGWRTAAIWGVAALAVLLALWLLSGILLPFVVGIAAAYILDPLADWLERHGFRRGVATLLITGLFFAGLATLLLVLLPVAIDQAVGLAGKLPGYFDELRTRILHLVERLERENVVEGGSVQGLASSFAERALSYVGTAVTNVVQSSLVVLNLVSLVFITPIVTFYLLRDWDRLVAALRSVVPPRHRPVARRLAREIDQVLAGFLRGQGMVCSFLALFYGTGLVLVGLDYGAIIGVLTGLFSFIPYVGMFVGVAVGLTVAIFQFGALVPVLLVTAVFAVGQFIEGNFLTPRVVGSRIRLHEVWVIFAVLAGTALFGLVGTFLATPVAAVIAVLVRFGVERWRRSDYFREAPAVPATPLPQRGDTRK